MKGDLIGLISSWSGGSLQDKDYAWDSMGNLISRTDNIAQRDETFGYDSLNRLSSSSVVSMPGATITTVPPPETYTYDTKGNLTAKGSSATLTYANASRPHAVSSAIVKGYNRAYAYDAAGYVTSDSKRDYQWTSFGQLSQLTYAAAPELRDFTGGLVHSAGYVRCDFEFDPSGNRARQTKERTAANDSREIEDTLYLGSYEREIHTTKTFGGASPVLAKTVHRHTLGGGIIYTKVIGGTAPGVKLTNVLADHLGSTDCLLNSTWNGSAFSAQTTEYQSFDAWGERRDATTNVSYRATDADPFRTSASDHDRGYTGHEQLDDSGIIHMNGRIYDPELGRFLSPDPVVQIPEYSQNFNRYSYVLNNPLNATDPSGFFLISKAFHAKKDFIKENWRTIVVIVVAVVLTIVTAGAFTAAAGLTGTAFATAATATTAASLTTLGGAAVGGIVGTVVGGLSAALAGGDLGDILRGAVVGGIQGAITGGALHSIDPGSGGLYSNPGQAAAHIVGHGIVGGAANVAMGGKFGDGFLSAAVSAAAANAGLYGSGGGGYPGQFRRTIMAGAVGGTASVIGGGKFANGAYTAAFQHLLNAELDKRVSEMSAGEAEKFYRKDSAARMKIWEDNKEYLQQHGFDTNDKQQMVYMDGPNKGKLIEAKARALWSQIYYDNGSGGNNGECASLCRMAGSGPASLWQKGLKISSNLNTPPGTAVANFSGNKFNGHAALYIGPASDGNIFVYEQFTPAHTRTWPANTGFPRVGVLSLSNANNHNGAANMYTIK